MNIKPLPKRDWTITFKGGRLVLTANHNADANSLHHTIFELTGSDAADNLVGIEDLEGVVFTVDHKGLPEAGVGSTGPDFTDLPFPPGFHSRGGQS